jgi:nucleoside 2-deoxyribosyltransferase
MIQPFDGGPFDKRYEDTIAPAIAAAGLEPYRVDRDPRVVIPIDEIEEGIRASQACVAEISTNNPNVWFELGYAIAAGKPVVLLAQHDAAPRFPFDVQHRHVIRYRTDSVSDFEKLRDELTTRLRAVVEKEARLERAIQPTSIAEVEGLSQHELVALVSIAENIDSPESVATAHAVRNDMEKSGFTRVAFTLALSQLMRKGFVIAQEERDWNDSYMAYAVTSEGMNWLHQHQDVLVLRRAPEKVSSPAAQIDKMPSPAEPIDDDEEVPF